MTAQEWLAAWRAANPTAQAQAFRAVEPNPDGTLPEYVNGFRVISARPDGAVSRLSREALEKRIPNPFGRDQ